MWGGLPFLPEEVDAHAVFPLGSGHANTGLWNPAPRMQWWVGRTRLIATLLFPYPQVLEYVSFHFCLMRLEMHVSVPSASTPRSPSTEATKGGKCRRLFIQALGYFFLLSRLVVSRHFYGVLDW